MERLWTSNVSISSGNIKYPIENQFFTVHLPSKLFPTAFANADTGNLKSLHTFL